MIVQSSSPLTALYETQRALALEGFTIIRSTLEKEVTQAEVVRVHHISLCTIQLWMRIYRELVLADLANAVCLYKGTFRRLPPNAITLIGELALQTPLRSATAIFR